LRKQVSENQSALPLAKRFLPKSLQTKKPRKRPENLEEWIVFGGDKRVVRPIQAVSLPSAISGLRHKFGISVGPQGYAKRRSDFPDDVVIYPGMTESQCFGIPEIGRLSQSHP